MASSSLHKRFKYDVFLSFRGEDVRKTFIDHLYASLDRQGILTFRDDKKLKKGERIDNELIKSIQDSKFFIIVFSQNYASSSWCLNELVEIMECQKNNNQIAYPVFYDVDPSEVRKQRESYGEALDKYNKKDAHKWSEALREAGSLSGYDVKNTADGLEAEVIKQIVAEILNQLCSTYYLSNDEKLVGMETRMLDLLSCLQIESSDVRMIGIKGMGGAGKTTLARAIFERISLHFEGVSFVDNVREKSKASVSGLQSLQEKILSDLLKEPDFAAGSLFDGKLMMRYRLRGVKALVVLDDVDDLTQLEALAGASDWFKPGSRIIITTRDEKVLVAHGVEIKHDVNLLSDEEAICLFSRYAFKGNIPLKGYEEHSRKVVDYAVGLPLTVKMLGSLLHDEGESVWIDVLKRLKTIPLEQTQDILELSYNSLEDEHKEIFLDVACLQKGWNKKKAIRTLTSCRFHAIYGLRVLQQKSLITFSQDCDIFSSFFDDDAADDDDNDDDVYLDMHDHIQEMGRNIVRREHPYDPSKHSRLWINKEIEDILVNELGTEATRCIKVVTSLDPEIIMKGLSGMKNLKFLHVNGTFSSDWKCDEASQYFLNALQYLHWNSYPFRFLPKGFQANNLVSLEMPFSKIEQLWEEGERKVLDNLKFLDLSSSKLTKLDLVLTPNLEVLKLKSCFHLLELDMPIRCPKLRSIDLSYSKLTKLDLGMTPNLEVLKLKKCRSSLELPMTVGCQKLRSLNLSNLKLTKLYLRLSSYLETLYLECCFNLVELIMPDECLKLRSLNVNFSALKKLNLGLIPNIEVLDLSRCHNLVELNMLVECLKLRFLDLKFLALKKLDLGMTPNLEMLNLSHCHYLIELDMPVECLKLRSLVLSPSLFKTLDPALIPNLETLCLHGKWYELLEPHMRIARRKLTSLTITCLTSTTLDLGLCPDLIHCEISWSKLKTFDLALTPKLKVLKLKDCHDLEELQMHVGCLKELAHLELVGCSGLKSFVLTKEQESHECQSILPLDSNDGMPKISISCFYKEQASTSTENLEKLISLGSCHCSNLKSILETTDWFPNLKEVILGCSIPEVPEDNGKLEHVEELKFSCTVIRDLPDNIVQLKDLKSLKLERCTSLEELPENIYRLDCLEKLHLSSTRIKHLPNENEACRLKCLKSLELVCCSFLEKLPENLGRLECLEDLILQECKLLQDIPNSIREMKSLRRFHLPYCVAVEKLPEEIGHLKSLVELNIVGTGIRHLPESISSLKDLRIIRYAWHLDMNGFTFASVQRISEMKLADDL